MNILQKKTNIPFRLCQEENAPPNFFLSFLDSILRSIALPERERTSQADLGTHATTPFNP